MTRRASSVPLRPGAFSLLEVIAAVALLAAGVLGVLGLFASVLRNLQEVEERIVAVRVLERVDVLIRREARAAGIGFETFAASTVAPRHYVADRVGAVVEPAATSTLEPGLQFFAIDVSRAAAPAWTPGQGFIVVLIRVSWPHAGGAVAVEQRTVEQSGLGLTP